MDCSGWGLTRHYPRFREIDVDSDREFAHEWIVHKLRHKRLAENHLMTSAELQNQVLNNILRLFLLFFDFSCWSCKIYSKFFDSKIPNTPPCKVESNWPFQMDFFKDLWWLTTSIFVGRSYPEGAELHHGTSEGQKCISSLCEFIFSLGDWEFKISFDVFLHVCNLQMWWVGPNTCMSC